MQHDPYQVLGVPRSASPAAIKKAFRARALATHPDRNPGDAAAEAKFKRVAEAYEILGDPGRRNRYDLRGRRRSAIPPGQSPEVMAFIHAFREAFARAEIAFFQQLLPHYIEHAATWPGYEVVYQMADDVVNDRLAERLAMANPGFGARDAASALRRECPIDVDGQVMRDERDELELGRATTVVFRGLGYRRVTLYAGSFFEKGHREADELSTAILRVLLEQYTRYLEHSLPAEHRPLLRHGIDGAFPMNASTARRRDRRASLIMAIKWGSGALVVLSALAWLFGWLD